MSGDGMAGKRKHPTSQEQERKKELGQLGHEGPKLSIERIKGIERCARDRRNFLKRQMEREESPTVGRRGILTQVEIRGDMLFGLKERPYEKNGLATKSKLSKKRLFRKRGKGWIN